MAYSKTEQIAFDIAEPIAKSFGCFIYDVEFVKEGGWKKSETFSPFVFPLSELKDKTIGIVGFGKIGQEVAKIAKAFSLISFLSSSVASSKNSYKEYRLSSFSTISCNCVHKVL